VKIAPAFVDDVVADSPAARAGFRPGDKVVEIDGEKIEKFEELLRIVSSNAGRELRFKVERGADVLTLVATPNADQQRDPFGRTYRRGLVGIKRNLSPDQIQTLSVGPIEAVTRAVQETYGTITQTISGIGDVLTSRQSAEQMGGPLLMAEVTAKVAELGVEPMLRWIAFISANIGFLNLLPIPVLDGGHLLFYGYEAVRRKPAPERFQQMGFQVGLALLMMLMIFVNFNDLLNVWRRLTGVG
jgi:regulator of sigma E protease